MYALLALCVVPQDNVFFPSFCFSSKVNQPKFNQRRISSAKFLGELYNYRMVESAVIFRTLYSFISFGINQDGSPSSLDPPEHLFRIRLVCTLLDTCGQYFDRGSSKRKLDCFLIYFQASWLLMRICCFLHSSIFLCNDVVKVLTTLCPSAALHLVEKEHRRLDQRPPLPY